MYTKEEKIVTKSGEVFVVDKEDFKNLSKYKWYFTSKGYAYRAEKKKGKQKNFLLHREIMGCNYKDRKIVDHINRNTFDCRKSNLRIVDIKVNSVNTSKTKNKKTSIYKGVSYHSCRKMFRATIKENGKSKHLGYFDCEKKAAIAWDSEAKKRWGNVAVLNFGNK